MKPTTPTVFGDAYAPITSAIGFLQAPIGEVSNALAEWRSKIHGNAETLALEGGFHENVYRLEPLTEGMAPRELVVGTANSEWCALFDCQLAGGDPSTTVGFLSRTMKVQGLAITSIPAQTPNHSRGKRYGAMQFEMFGPILTEFLNYVRTISLVQDGDRWRFDAAGTVQDFERTETYESRRVTDRFTPSMLVDYSAAMGLSPFSDDFYVGPSVLVANPSRPPGGSSEMSLAAVRAHYGL